MSYAKGTATSAANSRAELERVLKRYGAEAFAYAEDGSAQTIAFRLAGRSVRIDLPPVDRRAFELTDTGRERAERQVEIEVEKEQRRRWRVLVCRVSISHRGILILLNY